MKYCIIILLLLLYSCTGGQGNNKVVDTTRITKTGILTDTTIDLSYRKKRDTIFIHREVTSEYYHAIYIDTNRQSKFYTWITDFTFDNYELRAYHGNYEYFKEKHPEAYKKLNHTDLPEDWIPVYHYKNSYYLYAPSDWGNAGKRIINDSAFVYWYMDGPLPMPLIRSVEAEDNKYSLEIEGSLNGTSEKQKLTIYQIDPKTQLSVFEFEDTPDKYRYELYIPKKSARHFDMVVNYCDNQKQSEFDFDKIDFKSLIKNSR